MQRLTANYEAPINAPADAAWTMLREWMAIADWWPDDAPIQFIRIEPAGDPNTLPFSRKVFVAAESAVIETLIHADAGARRIYYQIENGTFPGIRNYLATTFIDEQPTGTCIMRFASMFDAAPDADGTQTTGLMREVYSAIARGISRKLSA